MVIQRLAAPFEIPQRDTLSHRLLVLVLRSWDAWQRLCARPDSSVQWWNIFLPFKPNRLWLRAVQLANRQCEPIRFSQNPEPKRQWARPL